MSEHGASLQNQFQMLASNVESLRMKKFNIQKQIEVQEEKKAKIEEEILTARSRANEVEENLKMLKSAQKDLDATINKAEEAFAKIEQNAGLLLALTKRTGDDLDKVFNKLNG